MTPEQEAQIIALCERVGMPWERAPGRHEPWNGWNGHALNLASGAGASGLIHEIAHWLLSAPEWRRLPGFGIGWKDDELVPPEHLKYGAYYDDEECAASLFGILIERELGIAWRETWSDHNWEEDAGTPGASWYVRRWFRDLQENGHLRGLTPTCLLDAASPTPRR